MVTSSYFCLRTQLVMSISPLGLNFEIYVLNLREIISTHGLSKQCVTYLYNIREISTLHCP